MDNKLIQVARVFAENEQAEALLKSAKTKEEAVAILAQFGVNVTVDEFVQIGTEVISDELSEDVLELVAGGSWKGFWQGFVDFWHGLLDSH